MIRLVLTDMDFTLTNPRRMQASDRALAAIDELLELGVRFGPASGRDLRDLRAMFGGHDECLATGLVSNGKRIYADGRLIYHQALDHDALERLLAALRADVPGAFVICRSEHGDRACGVAPEAFARTVWASDPHIVPVPDLPSWEVTTAGIMWDPDDASIEAGHVEEVACAVCPELHFLSPADGMLDVLPAGWTKASGARILIGHLGIAREEVCAFGDSDNDLALLEYLPNSVAVANANDAARRAARWHIGSTWDDAVGEALAQLARATRAGETPAFMRG